MEIKSKYISADEFKLYTGVDLAVELADSSMNPSDAVESFLYRLESNLEAYIEKHFNIRVADKYPSFTDYQKEHYKKALLEQGAYILDNSRIDNDSGYNPNRGKIADRGYLESIAISTNAINHLALCGLWNRKVHGRRRSSLEGWWLY